MNTADKDAPSIDGLMRLVFEFGTIEAKNEGKATDAGNAAYLAVRAYAELVAVHPAEMMDTEVQKSKTAHPVVGLPCKDLQTALSNRPRNICTPYNVGMFCMSEDDCIEAGISFAAYERGVNDAAEAFGMRPADDPMLSGIAASEAVSGSAKTALSVENRWLGDMMILQVLADSDNVNEQEREVLARWLASSPLPPGESAGSARSDEKAPAVGVGSPVSTAMEVLPRLLQLIDKLPEWERKDHACAKCAPFSDLIKPGWDCALHRAKALVSAQGTTPGAAP